MQDAEGRLAKSLSAETTELIPFLPYLLQDLWELGSSPSDIEALIRKHVASPEQLSILDLACGKGAVSVHLAKAFGCRVKGIDLMPQFIIYASQKAEVFEVRDLCEFVIGDINEAVCSEQGFDVVILGAAGNVLGDQVQTIDKLKQTVKDDGYILIDDACSREGKGGESPSYDEWLEIFKQGEVKLLEGKLVNEAELIKLNELQQAFIRRRAAELKLQHPHKTAIFDGYVASQQAECDELENDIFAVTWLLQKCAIRVAGESIQRANK
jgi:ubiquinone/menaquinone biosynthesis C-methylase UbiE